MRITLATHGFAAPGGSETYLLTVAEQLQRLGHEPTILASDLGAMSEFAGERGIEVTSSPGALADGGDAMIVQDAILAYQLADRCPETPQVFRAASDMHDLQLPPALPGLVGAVVGAAANASGAGFVISRPATRSIASASRSTPNASCPWPLCPRLPEGRCCWATTCEASGSS